MARANPYTDEEKDGVAPSDVEHLGGTPGGGLTAAPTGPALGMSAAGGTAQAQPGAGKGDRQDQFVSWDRLFDANAGNANRTAEAVLGKVQGDVDKSKGAFKTLETNGGTATQNHNPITYARGEGTPAPAPFGTTTPQTMPGPWTSSGGEYTGATDISSLDGYEAAMASLAPVANDMDVLHNRRTGNIMSLLGQNTPGGNSRLDNALVNRSGGDRFDATYGQYGNYADAATTAANTTFAGQRAGGESAAKQAQTDGATEATRRNTPPPKPQTDNSLPQMPETVTLSPKPRDKDWGDYFDVRQW